MKCDWIKLPVSDGTEMRAYAAWPEGAGQHPGLIVLQEAYGVNGHIRGVTDRFAREGYCCVAPELFHRTAPGQEFPYTDFGAARPHMSAITPDAAVADLRAAFEWLSAQPVVARERIAGVGYCMGGRMSFLANSALPLTHAVSYYGGGIAPGLLDRAASLHAPMLFFWGELDKHIPPEQRAAVLRALNDSGKQYTNVEFSNADHGFFCDERPSYNPVAAQQAWALTLAFLKT